MTPGALQGGFVEAPVRTEMCSWSQSSWVATDLAVLSSRSDTASAEPCSLPTSQRLGFLAHALGEMTPALRGARAS